MPRRNPPPVPLRRFVCDVTLANGQQLTTTIHARTPWDAEHQETTVNFVRAVRIVVRQELSA